MEFLARILLKIPVIILQLFQVIGPLVQNSELSLDSGAIWSRIEADRKKRFNTFLLIVATCFAIGCFALIAMNTSVNINPTPAASKNLEIDKKFLAQLEQMTNAGLHELSQSCLRKNDSICLVGVYGELSKREPGNLKWSANLGFRLTHLGYHQEAIEIYEQIANAPDATYDIHAYYGHSLQKLGQHEEAVTWLKKALAINPRLADTTRELAVSLVTLGRIEEARRLIADFKKRYPEAESYFRDVEVNLNTESAKAKKVTF